MRRRATVLPAVLAAAALLVTGRARADELPSRHHALLLLRVLAYDRHLVQRSGAAVTVLLLSQAGDRVSEVRTEALRQALERVATEVVVAALPVKVRALPYRDAAALEASLASLRPALVCLDGALAPAVPDIVRVTRRRGVFSAGVSRAMVEAGASVAVAASGGRAVLTINPAAARAEGADLDASLLALAQIVMP